MIAGGPGYIDGKSEGSKGFSNPDQLVFQLLSFLFPKLFLAT